MHSLCNVQYYSTYRMYNIVQTAAFTALKYNSARIGRCTLKDIKSMVKPKAIVHVYCIR